MNMITLLAVLSFVPINFTAAMEECWWIGSFVEVAEQTVDEERRLRQWSAWIYLAPDKRRKAAVLRARAAYQAGVTSQQIYRDCASI